MEIWQTTIPAPEQKIAYSDIVQAKILSTQDCT